ncbi:MAG: DUF3943 domain-containing protein [Melioribacteraceae bacterium]|nr:DUF3943 domain-containing protein [Melioribacteraceae bacterium]
MKRKWRTIFATLFLMINPIEVFNQTKIIPFNSDVKKNNSAINYNISLEEKNYWLAATEVVGINVLVWANSKYLAKQDWADISASTIKENIKHGFTWDSDSFTMNQFLHPYHGAAYFNAARSNGLTFWESAPYVFGGSLMWEYLMENEPPSYNDLLNTTISGIILGEITYRVSDLIIDESTSGFERFSREVASLLINPIKGFNRLIKGNMWKSGVKKKNSETQIMLSLGVSSLFVKREISSNYLYLLAKFEMDYGNKFATSRHKTPFDYFRVNSEFNFASQDNVIGISASGVLWDTKFKTLSSNKSIAGLYKEFDLYLNNVYKFTATSLSTNLSTKYSFSSYLSFQGSLGFSGIFVGATNSIYATLVGKDYNLGPGLGIRVFSSFQLYRKLTVNLNYSQFWIHIMNGINGDEFIGIFNFGVLYKLSDRISIGSDIIFYERYGKYDIFSNIYISNAFFRIYTKFYL